MKAIEDKLSKAKEEEKVNEGEPDNPEEKKKKDLESKEALDKEKAKLDEEKAKLE